jgi:hypothetical protein
MGGIQPEFGARFGPESIVLERICSPWIRLCFGSLPSASFVKVERRCSTSTTSNIRPKLRVQTERLYDVLHAGYLLNLERSCDHNQEAILC